MNLKENLIDRWKGFWSDPELSYWKILSLILAFYVLYLMLSMDGIIKEHNEVFESNWRTYYCFMAGNPNYREIASMGNTTTNFTSKNLTIIKDGLNVSIGRILTK